MTERIMLLKKMNTEIGIVVTDDNNRTSRIETKAVLICLSITGKNEVTYRESHRREETGEVSGKVIRKVEKKVERKLGRNKDNKVGR